MDKQYKLDYNRGWRTSEKVGNLDQADRDGRSNNDAWMDGYLDYAAGREKFHLANCTDHNNCP